MGRVWGPSGEYALVSEQQWDELLDAVAHDELERARELLLTWQPPTWLGDGGPSGSDESAGTRRSTS